MDTFLELYLTFDFQFKEADNFNMVVFIMVLFELILVTKTLFGGLQAASFL